MARLSVNLNKIALLRNSRRTGVPDVLRFGRLAHDAGAHGLTVHPRPDERHIRRSDVPALAELMAPWRPAFEFNIEGYPDDDFLGLVERVRPEQCTLVPDAPDTFTSEEGWRLDGDQAGLVGGAVARLKASGCRAVVFVDPDPRAVERAAAVGADGIEIYTGGYGAAFATGDHGAVLELCAAAARRAAGARPRRQRRPRPQPRQPAAAGRRPAGPARSLDRSRAHRRRARDGLDGNRGRLSGRTREGVKPVIRPRASGH